MRTSFWGFDAEDAVEEVEDHDPLDEMGMDEILEPHSFADFKLLEKIVWNDLVEAHTNMALIEKRAEYPSKLLRGRGRLFGWYDYQLFLMAALILHRVQNDQGGDAITFARLKRFIFANVRPVYHEAVRARLKKAKPTAAERAALEKIGTFRDNRLAHSLEEARLSDAEDSVGFSFSELKAAASALRKQYQAMRPGVSAFFEVVEHVDALGHLLDLVVINTRWSTYFDEQSEEWQGTYRPMLSAGEFAALNRIRVRRHMPPIPDTLGAHLPDNENPETP
jgi:hypothetical protein